MGDLLLGPFILVGRNWFAQSTLNSGWRFLRFPIARGHAGILQEKDFVEVSSPNGFSDGLYHCNF